MSDEKKTINLFNNPMVDIAMKALTQEQKDEYKKIGDYMFSTDYNQRQNQRQTQDENDINILKYAEEGLKAGMDPLDLTDKEIQVLTDMRGIRWYEKYGYDENEVPKSSFGLTHSFQQYMAKQANKVEQ